MQSLMDSTLPGNNRKREWVNGKWCVLMCIYVCVSLFVLVIEKKWREYRKVHKTKRLGNFTTLHVVVWWSKYTFIITASLFRPSVPTFCAVMDHKKAHITDIIQRMGLETHHVSLLTCIHSGCHTPRWSWNGSFFTF